MTAHPYTGDPALKTRARRNLRALIAAKRLPCQAPACKYPGQPIDYQPQRKGQPWNPLGYELGEIVPRAMGGRADDPGNVRPEHADCNRAEAHAISQGRGTVEDGPRLLIGEEW